MFTSLFDGSVQVTQMDVNSNVLYIIFKPEFLKLFFGQWTMDFEFLSFES